MTQKNAPSAVGAATEGQNVSIPIPEENPNMNIIAPTDDVREPIRPIYGPSDPRWAELGAWFDRNAQTLIDRLGNATATLEELWPTERAEWHAMHVLGVDVDAGRNGVQYAEFPSVPAPSWSTSEDDRGIEVVSERPMHAFIRDLGPNMTIEQDATFDPDSGTIRWSEIYLSLYLDDGNTEIRVTNAADARRISLALRAGAAALEDAVREASA